MNRDDIIRMAREAGAVIVYDAEVGLFGDAKVEAFANLVAAAERERILDICKEGLWDSEGIRFHLEKQGSDQ